MRQCITNNYSPSDRRNYTPNGEKTRRYRDLKSATTKKNIFRTFNIVRRETSKQNLEELSPDDLNDTLSFSLKEHLRALTTLPYAK